MHKSIAFFIGLVGTVSSGFLACDTEIDGSQTSLSGTVTNELEQPIADIEVTAGELSTKTDIDGAFVLEGLKSGSLEVTLSGDWYEDSRQTVALEPGENVVSFQLPSRSLQVTNADKTTYEAYLESFDWSVDTVSVVYAPRPTRAAFEAALYYHNPALFNDPSGEPTVVPQTLPELGPAGVSGLDFVITDMETNNELTVLDVETAVDSIDETPLSAEEIGNAMMWEPAIELYLAKWNLEESRRLYAAAQAIRSERFGGSSVLPPVVLEHLFLHGSELWVELVFAPFLTLGQGITDSDADGSAEIYVRLAAELYTDDVTTKLAADYVGIEYDTLGLVDNLAVMLDDLYSRTNPQVVSTIGLPYETSNGLSFEYPFAVLEHNTGTVNVLLVEP